MIIDTEILIKNRTISNNLVTCCIFKMKESYRDFNKYVDRLDNILKNKDVYFKNFNFRIYTDRVTYDDAYFKEMLDRHDNFELILYRCDHFFDGVYHEGTFGTIVRLLPLFEKNEYDIIVQIDVDLNDNLLKVMSDCLNQFIESDNEFVCKTYVCYPRTRIPVDNKFNIINNFIASKIKFPMNLLSQFLKNVKHDKITSALNENAIFPYGTDELFTNTILYNYLINHKIKVMHLKRFTYTPFLSFLKKHGINVLREKHVKYIKKLERNLYYQVNMKDHKKYLSIGKKTARHLLSKYEYMIRHFSPEQVKVVTNCSNSILNNYQKYRYPHLHIVEEFVDTN